MGIITENAVNHIAGEYDRSFSRQQVAENFWEEASSQIWNHGDDVIACRLRELGVHHEVDAIRGLVGVAHEDQINALCPALGRAKPKSIREDGASIVLPFYDLPGRISGFLLVQTGQEFAIKKTFIPITGYKKRKAEAGHFLLQTMTLPPHKLLSNKQFIVDDALWVLTEQCRQLKYGLGLLPIAAAYYGPEATSYGTNWLSFQPAPRLFQSEDLSPELISQACTAKGYVCVAPLDVTSKKTHLYPLQRLGKIHAAAETWQTSLRKALTGTNEITAYSFASKLTVPHAKLSVFFRNHAENFTDEFSRRVLRTIDIAPAMPTKVGNKWILIEQDNSWWNHVGQQVCSAKVVITKIIQSDEGAKLYRGKIYLGEWELEFEDNAAKIENMGMLAYAAATAAPYGKLITFDRTWNKRSHLMSIQLYTPELVMVSAKLGWDDSAGLFRLGSYAINNSGETVLALDQLKNRQRSNFPEPSPVAPITIRQFLTPSPQNAFVWTVFASIAADLLAPVVGHDPAATMLTEREFHAAAKIGLVLNCPHEQTTSLQKSAVVGFTNTATRDSQWPMFLSNAFSDSTFTAVITRAHNRAIFVKMPEMSLGVVQGYGWHSISAPPPPLTTDYSVLQYVLPTYIQRALKLRMTLTTKHKNTTVAVLRDLHAWLQETYGDSFHLPQALQQLGTPETAHEALMCELNRAILCGKLDVMPRPRRKDQPRNYLLRRKTHWWINRRAVDNYFHSCKNVPPNWLAVIDLWVNQGLCGGEETIHGAPGILVNTDWCDKFWDDGTDEATELG